MLVLFASSEAYPLAKTGGLADVSAALPVALRNLGVDVQLIVPGYRQAMQCVVGAAVVAEVESPGGFGVTRLIRAKMPCTGVPVWLVDCPALFNRSGTLYQDDDGNDWSDNGQRFAYFSAVAAALACGTLAPGWRADVVHANDWHTGLLPIQLGNAGSQRPASVFTIHNLAYQGLFPGEFAASLSLPDGTFTADGVEFYGWMSFIKAGIRFADRITTVSPSYAREILTPDYGCGLDGLLRQRINRLSGILNGVDYRIWDPRNDCRLEARFAPDDIAGKPICKASLQREMGLAVDPTVPLLVWLSRITDQKMADTVLHALPAILARDLQFALLGEGDRLLEEQFQDAAEQYPGRLAVQIGYGESLAHRFLAGADMLLHPSRFEPCGLTPLYAMRYGALPIVRHVGGLADTIVDATEWTIAAGNATGFAFREATIPAMLDCLDRALAFYTKADIWRQMQWRAMTREFGWDASARRYLSLYRKLAPHSVQPRVDDRARLPRFAKLSVAA